MKPVCCIYFIAIILLISGVGSASDIATVHGVAYEWSTFEPLDNAIIEVNSTPAQSMVAKYGVYSFELSNGTYMITASYYEDDQLTSYAEDLITVSDEGSYVLDLLLVPSYSDQGDSGSTVDAEDNSSNSNSNSILYVSILLVLVLLIVLVSQMKRRPQSSEHASGMKTSSKAAAPVVLVPAEQESALMEKATSAKTESYVGTGVKEEKVLSSDEPDASEVDVSETVEVPKIEETSPANAGDVSSEPTEAEPVPQQVAEIKDMSKEPVPADLQEILDILRSQGGRMTQKDMRKRLKYSEGKVSLMLLDLEKRGKIQKFKKGRGNVLFLVDQEK